MRRRTGFGRFRRSKLTDWGIAGTIAGVAAMLLLLVFLDVAAASSALHAAVCPDAGKSTDSCAVVVFATGKIASSSPPVLCLPDVAGLPVPSLRPSEIHPAAPLFRSVIPRS